MLSAKTYSSLPRSGPPPPSTLFPYTTLFRSIRPQHDRVAPRGGLPDSELAGIDGVQYRRRGRQIVERRAAAARGDDQGDRKSTRLNSSHPSISYAVFCLKKKTTTVFR